MYAYYTRVVYCMW